MFNISSTPTNTIITPLVISQHASLDLGELKPLGCYHHAINFLTAQDSLLTLHRFGKGFTPSGWLLKNRDFDRIHYLMQLQLPFHLINSGIYCNGITIIQENTRRVPLTINPQLKPKTATLQNIIRHYDKVTGLYGNLATLDFSPKNDVFQQYYDFLYAIANNTAPDFSHLLGKGPGLTPSSDDILIGLIAYSFTQSILAPHLLSTLISLQTLSNLTPYTTLISSYFIAQASSGLFSSNLLHILNTPHSSLKLEFHVKKLLNYGHTSGADVLVGLCLAESIFNHY